MEYAGYLTRAPTCKAGGKGYVPVTGNLSTWNSADGIYNAAGCFGHGHSIPHLNLGGKYRR
jgi:hypothetical protein